MTGHGRGESSGEGRKVTVEVSSVNRKQSEISISLPRELDALEGPIRDEANKRVSRGRVNIRVLLQSGEGGALRRTRLNEELAEAYARDLRKLAKKLKLGGELTLDLIARAPGVFDSEGETLVADQLWPLIRSALVGALDALVKMRENEGKHLAADLRSRVEVMRKAAKRVGRLAPGVMERYREQLVERLKAAGVNGVDPMDERLLKEVVLFSDRSDISEELTRLESHFKQFDGCLKSAEPVGRTLDFLSQEMNREINTIGSKANDAEIAREVVLLKTELEKFREQVQNVE